MFDSMLGNTADSVKKLAQRTATTVPQPIQLVVAFVLYPLYWAGFVHLMTCIPVVGVFIPFFVVGDLTGSVRIAFLATAIAPALDFFLFVFGVSWAKKIPGMAMVITMTWIGILVLSLVGWFVYPLFI